MARVFDEVDLLAMPTVPTTAPRIDGPVDGRRILRNTWPFNAARLPALSIPCGPPDKLPVGLQIVGRAFEDERVLGAGAGIAALLRQR
jgi:aspartyl-tRNA(Asn)/glutamyl-tRNA(Gln) amidotransferase subunit A